MSLSSRSRKMLKRALGSNVVGNEIADMMGGVLQQTEIKCMKAVSNEVKEITQLVSVANVGVREVTQLVCPAEAGRYERTQIEVIADTANDTNQKYIILYDELGSVGFYMENGVGGVPAGLAGVGRVVKITGVTNGMTKGQVGTVICNAIAADLKFVKISDDAAGIFITEASLPGLRADGNVVGAAGYTLTVVTQGAATNYNGLFFKIYDDAGSVGVWFDVDNAGTLAPAGALACTRQIEISTLTTAMTAGQVGTAIYTAMLLDSKFGAGADNTAGTITLKSSTFGVKTLATAETSPIAVTRTAAGRACLYNGKTFVLYDEVGSVGFWFDTENVGTAAPAEALACDRAVEINTISGTATRGAIGTAIYNAIVADAKFDAGADDADGTFTVVSTTFGVKTDGSAGNTPLTVTVATPGVESDYDGDYIVLADDAGTVGIWIDVDNLGTTIPAGANACDRTIEVTTITSGMTAVQAAAALEAVVLADPKFVTVKNAGDGSFIIVADAVGARPSQTNSDSLTMQVTDLTVGAANGGTLSAKAQKVLSVNLFGANYTAFKTAVEAGAGVGTISTALGRILKSVICDNKTSNEIIALY